MEEYQKEGLSDGRRSQLERLVSNRLGELAMFEHMMQAGHEFNFPSSKNHLMHFEMEEVGRANRWRPDYARLEVPTPSMYEASRLMRYLPEEEPPKGD